MAVPSSLDIVRVSLDDLWKLDKAQCNQMLQAYNGTAATSAEPMTVRTLALTVALLMLQAFTILCSGLVRMILGRQGLNKKLEPVVRTLLRITFVLFLPALSSVFSLTKDQGGTGFLLTLLWLLLVELIRMEVQAMAVPTDGSSFSRSGGGVTPMNSADEIGHMLWAGYLVFFNMGGQTTHGQEAAAAAAAHQKAWAHAMMATFAILWSLSFVRLLQRMLDRFTEGISWHTGRNPLLIAAYMQHVVPSTPSLPASASASSSSSSSSPSSSPSPDDLMESCQFVVDGEHKLVFKKKKHRRSAAAVVTTAGYGHGVGRRQRDQHDDQSDLKHVSLQLHLDDSMTSKLVTVGKVWKWGKQRGDIGRLFRGDRRRGSFLQDLCLSFSLFKLLRRRFEQYPMVEVGSDMVRSVMLKGLLGLEFHGGDDGPKWAVPADRPFRVLLLELEFLQDYYQTTDRAAMSRRGVFVPKIVLSTLFVPLYLVAILAILVTTKDADYFYCMAVVSTGRVRNNFPFLAFSITLALLATFVCFQSYEIFTSYFNFNWNLVRLLCYYGNLPAARGRDIFVGMIKSRYKLYSVTSFLFRRQAYINVPMKQASILDSCGCGLIDKLFGGTLGRTPVYLATKAKEDIIQAMKNIDKETLKISLPHPLENSTTSWATKSATEIILASHLATELLVIMHPKTPPSEDDGRRHGAREVATTLSRYCMYLVAHMPELLPDDNVWVSRRLEEMRTCLEDVLRHRMSCMPGRCCKKNTLLVSLKAERDRLDDDTATRDAVELLEKVEKMKDCWDQLAKFWVSLIIYVAPSNDVQGHANALATSGADLISCLWAFCTHTGITREERPETQQGSHHV